MKTSRWFLLLSLSLSACGLGPTPQATPTAAPPPTATVTPLPTPPPTPPNVCEDDNPYNGFLYHSWCIPGVVTQDFWLGPNPNHFVGMAVYYSPGIMEEVMRNRGLRIDGHIGAVALMLCGDIGRTVYIRRSPDNRWEGPFLVADCTGRNHLYYNIVINRVAVEVDWHTAQRWAITGGGLPTVHVCKTYPDCGMATTLATWLINNIEWELEAPRPTLVGRRGDAQYDR